MADKKMEEVTRTFSEAVAGGRVEVYNEFSLQHEYGIYLRSTMSQLKVQFERNVAFFFDNPRQFIKKEIDIVAFSPDKTLKHSALELKFPTNGQYPEQMFKFCKDIAFLEQLKHAGFANAYFLAFADDRLFYGGPGEGIYGYFRSGVPLTGTITKPTGTRNDSVRLTGTYRIRWHSVRNDLRYAFLEI